MPASHPLRAMRALLDEARVWMSRTLNRVYAEAAVAYCHRTPERLVWTLVLGVPYSIYSKQLLIEQLDCKLMLRGFVGLSIDEPVPDHSSPTKSRKRPTAAKVAQKLLRWVARDTRCAGPLSNEDLRVELTLIESSPTVKNMRPCAGRVEPAELHCLGHEIFEHRTGLPVDAEVTEANGFAECEAALTMFDRLPRLGRRTLATDKANDSVDFVAAVRQRQQTPHVAGNGGRWGSSTLDERTAHHAGQRASQRLPKRVWENFGRGEDSRPMQSEAHDDDVHPSQRKRCRGIAGN